MEKSASELIREAVDARNVIGPEYFMIDMLLRIVNAQQEEIDKLTKKTDSVVGQMWPH